MHSQGFMSRGAGAKATGVGRNVPEENTETREEDHHDRAGWHPELREVRMRTGAWDEMT